MKTTTLALLFVVIFAITATLCAGHVGGQSKRCSCSGRIAKRIRLRSIKHVETLNPSPSCFKTEILITVRSGKKVCLDPEGKQGQRILSGKFGKKPGSQRGKKQRRNKQ